MKLPLLPTASLLLFTLSFSSEPNVERPGERLGERLLLLPGLRLFLNVCELILGLDSYEYCSLEDEFLPDCEFLS